MKSALRVGPFVWVALVLTGCDSGRGSLPGTGEGQAGTGGVLVDGSAGTGTGPLAGHAGTQGGGGLGGGGSGGNAGANDAGGTDGGSCAGSAWQCRGTSAGACGAECLPSGPVETSPCGCDQELCIGPNECGLNHPRQCLNGAWVFLQQYCLSACPAEVPSVDMRLGAACSSAIIRPSTSCGYTTASGCQQYQCVNDRWTVSPCTGGTAAGGHGGSSDTGPATGGTTGRAGGSGLGGSGAGGYSYSGGDAGRPGAGGSAGAAGAPGGRGGHSGAGGLSSGPGAGGQSGFGQPMGGQSGFGGGSANPPPTCDYPLLDLSLGPFTPASTSATLDTVLAQAMSGIVGNWHGVVQTPWVPDYEVTLTFRADGTYSGQCLWSSNVCCRAFYYGTDDDSSLKRYTLDTINTEKAVSGTIDIIFGGRGVPYYESGYQGYLRSVRLNADASRLQFDFWYSDTYGPLKFDLERVP